MYSGSVCLFVPTKRLGFGSSISAMIYYEKEKRLGFASYIVLPCPVEKWEQMSIRRRHVPALFLDLLAVQKQRKKFNPVMKNLQRDRAVSAQYRWCKVLHKLVPQLLKKNEFIGIGSFRNWYRVLQKLIW
jgi:hypothetical protein